MHQQTNEPGSSLHAMDALSSADEDRRDRIRATFGSIGLFSGLAILALLAADRTGDLPLDLPRTWYVDRAAWVAAGLLALVGGWYLLGDRKRDPESPIDTRQAENKPPKSSSRRFERVVLYTRQGCHLCDLARETLEKYREFLPPTIEIDIDADPELVSRFTTCVPVVEIDGRVRFRGHVNEVLLRRMIRATPEKLSEGRSAV
jgi:glutaredoxin